MSSRGADQRPDPASTSDDDFEALCGKILHGRHLPAVADLIRGCPFLRDDLATDARAFASKLRASIEPAHGGELLMFALTELSMAPSLDQYLIAAAASEASMGQPLGKFRLTDAAAARCHFYAALCGCRESIRKVASYAVSALYSPGLPPGKEHSLAVGTIGWLLATTGSLELPRNWSRQASAEFLARAVVRTGPGAKLLERILETRRNVLDNDADQFNALEPRSHFVDEAAAALEGTGMRESPELDDNHGTVVVVRAGGNASGSEGKRIREEFRGLLGVALPRLRLPAPASVRAVLVSEYPHAETAIDRLLATSSGPFPPTVLVGPSGCGKTSIALRLGALLEVPVELVSCGGLGDGLAGTSRRWSTSEPSLPLSLIQARRHASPAIILDEIDKAAGVRASGTLWDSLVGLLDKRSAKTWRDPLLEAPVDLSHVVWIGTAQDVGDLPRALLDRFRVIRVPQPKAGHLPRLAHRLLEMDAAEKGLDSRWAKPLDQVEVAALSAAWRGGSLRHLAKLVAVVAKARELDHARH